jgi:hypothetical protein
MVHPAAMLFKLVVKLAIVGVALLRHGFGRGNQPGQRRHHADRQPKTNETSTKRRSANTCAAGEGGYMARIKQGVAMDQS